MKTKTSYKPIQLWQLLFKILFYTKKGFQFDPHPLSPYPPYFYATVCLEIHMSSNSNFILLYIFLYLLLWKQRNVTEKHYQNHTIYLLMNGLVAKSGWQECHCGCFCYSTSFLSCTYFPISLLFKFTLIIYFHVH